MTAKFNGRRFLMTRLALVILALGLLVGLPACQGQASKQGGPTVEDQGKHRQPGTRDFVALLDKDPALKAMVEKSLAMAAKENPDRASNPAQTLDEFYDFLDWSFTCMPWNILKDQPHPKLYEQIDQSLDYFYFALDRPLPELEGKGFYRSSLQYLEPIRTWLIQYARTWGQFLSTPQSWNEQYLKLALDDERFGLTKGWYEDPSGWKSFNDFFARYLKSPDQRPIASPEDPSVVVSPADSMPQGVWPIGENSNLLDPEGANVKSSTVYGIGDLLGQDSPYKDAFAGGVLTHTFLDVHDYHRYHFSVGGVLKELKVIAQDDAAGGLMLWDAEKKKYRLDASVPGWQFIETRGVAIVETPDYGLVALIPVGMSQVSSVNFEANLKVGDTVKKGDMLGAFLFGGSDFILLFQAKAGFQLTAPTDETGAFKHILMGEAYGVLQGLPKAP